MILVGPDKLHANFDVFYSFTKTDAPKKDSSKSGSSIWTPNVIKNLIEPVNAEEKLEVFDGKAPGGTFLAGFKTQIYGSAENISHKGPVCAVDLMAIHLTVSHLLKGVGMRCYPFLCVIALRACENKVS